jgi:hypothetical protein
MPADEAPGDPDTGQRRCPVCWAWFTPNAPSNPYPRRYCCGACRIQDSRRRREAEQTRLLPDAKLNVLRAARHLEDEHREATAPLRHLDRRRDTMNPD